MITRPINYRYYNYYKWNKAKHEPYDYEKQGLLNKIMSRRILNTNNESLKIILNYLEYSLVFLMKYTDNLKYFKDVHWKNR